MARAKRARRLAIDSPERARKSEVLAFEIVDAIWMSGSSHPAPSPDDSGSSSDFGSDAGFESFDREESGHPELEAGADLPAEEASGSGGMTGEADESIPVASVCTFGHPSREDLHREEPPRREPGIHPGNQLFLDVLGQEILLVMEVDQLNILGQTFRPVFCGTVSEVTDGFITLDPVIIKMPNAPFHRNPFPLSFPLEKIDNFTPFDCTIRFPLV